MLPTYRAVLRGDHLEWEDEVPEQLGNQQGLEVFVTFIGNSLQDGEQRGRLMADALERLAQKGGVSSIANASDWQREQREERELPGRTD